VRVLRIHHGGRDPRQRRRERALVAQGVDLTLVVPARWPGGHDRDHLLDEPFRVVELEVDRPGDPFRYEYRRKGALADILDLVQPDVIDLQEEPRSAVARQWVRAVGPLPVALHTSQNLDQRLPPVLSRRERRVLARADALYPTSRQAASVARGKGFAGIVRILPTGYDAEVFYPGGQSWKDPELLLGLVGRLTVNKGVLDAVRVLAEVRRSRAARLLLVGDGPAVGPALRLAADLGVADSVEATGWCSPERVAEYYRQMHIVLAPSHGSPQWVERRARVAVEAQASGAVVAGYSCGVLPEAAGRAGVLVPERDHWGLARAVARLVTDEGEFSWRRGASIHAATQYGWSGVARQQIDLYRRILPGTHDRVLLPRTATGRRLRARSEFGFPARTVTTPRPLVLTGRRMWTSGDLPAVLPTAGTDSGR
jgi:glycosyltransferase involved in cell wall biosynthesis